MGTGIAIQPRKIYVCGKMRGLPAFNFEEFFVAAKRLKDLGWIVVNPAATDVEYALVLGKKRTLAETFVTDIEMLSDCDAIYMLKGWQEGKLSWAEYHTAVGLGIEIIEEGDEV